MHNESGERLPAVTISHIEEAVSQNFQLTEQVECSLIFLSSQAMRALNNKTRGINRATDVLSFPLHNAIPHQIDADGIIRLGDIYIALSVARRQAQDRQHSTSQEVQELIVHGILHLMGYDHDTKQNIQHMTDKAERILQLIKQK